MGTTTSTSGNDNISAGSGNDVIDGGAGSDRLNAGSGNDILVYQLLQNTGAIDTYQGGSGWDTVRLMLTSAELDSTVVQSELSRYYTHLGQVQRNSQTGEVSNGIARDFTFNFGSGTTLTVSMMEALQVYRDGFAVNIDAPYIDGGDSTLAGAVKEDTSAQTTSTGTLQFVDLDVTDSHVYSTTAPANALGSMALTQLDDSIGDGVGHLKWSYSLDNANPAVQALAEGQVVVEQHQVRIADADNPGNFVVATITITITGTNDGPVVSAEDVSGAVTEMATPAGALTDSGTIGFSDVDLIDVHSLSEVTPSAGALGTLTATITSSPNDVDGAGGVITWNYSVDAAALEYLAKDQTKIETFSFTLSDGQGGVVVRTVSVTLTGTNDGPVVSAEDVSGAVTEMATPAGELTDSGTIGFSDVDLIDIHSLSAVTPSAGALGTLTATITSSPNDVDGAGGVISWNYSVDAAALEYLAKDQTKIETFSFTLSDGQGGEVVRTVSVTLTGTNDAPTVSASDASTFVEAVDASSQGLSQSGTVSFDDVDATDVVDVSSSYNGDIVWTGGPLSDAQKAALTAGTFTATTNDAAAPGSTPWSYAATASLDFLAAGETITFSFTVTATDSHGASATDVVNFSITGSNDTPTVIATAASDFEEAIEAAAQSLIQSGSVSFDDVDATDVVDVSSSYNDDISWSGGELSDAQKATLTQGTFEASVTDAMAPGNTPWTYAATASLDFLGAGETITFSYTVTATDSQGASASDVVSFTITGTNDAPVIAGEASGAVQEDLTTSVTGQLTSTDADSGATATWTVDGSNVGAYGSIAVDGTGRWTYTLANGTNGIASAVQSLAAGEAHDEMFVLQVSDGLGGIAQQTVTVTVTGTNDGPVVAAGDVVGGVTELGVPVGTLGDNGTIAFSDVDLIDVHSLSAVTPSAGALGTLTATITSSPNDVDGAGGVITWNYSVDAAALEYLAKDQTKIETFSFTLSDDQGGEVVRTVSVTLTGTNDAPTVSASDASTFVEAVDASSQGLSQSGTVSFDDVDATDVVNVSSSYNGDIVWTGGTLSDAQKAALTAGTFTATTNDAAAPGSTPWTYAATAALDFLAVGQSITFSYTITATDSHGASASDVVSFTITGTNDAPVISGVVTGVAKEDTTLTATGQLTATDIDNGSTATWTVEGSSTGTYGSMVVDTTGKWTYTLANGSNGVASAVQSLAAGESRNESFTIRVSDGLGGSDDQIVVVTVTGTNDAASITGTHTGSVTEDGTLSAGGTLSVSDVDTGQAGFQAPAPSALVGTYGTFTFTVATGVWTYALNNASAAVQALNTGDVRHDTLVLTSTDGSTSRTLDVTINGTNDPVVNRPPTDLMLSKAIISETSRNQIEIGTFSAVDDPGSTFTYTLVDNAGGRFAINSSTGVLTLARTDLIDFENASSHGIQVRVTDAFGASYTETFTINVADAPLGTSDSGDNVRDGTNGDESLSGGSGDDRIFGGNGNDVLQGDNGTDALYGQGGNDILDGGQNNDIVLDGGAGMDTLLGGQNDDVLLGGLGIDTMTGGQGGDLYIWRAEDLGSGPDVITDFSPGGGNGPDKLCIGDLLVDFVQGTSVLADFVKVTGGVSGSPVTVSIDQNGAVGGASFVDLVTITGANVADVTAALITTNYLKDQYIG